MPVTRTTFKAGNPSRPLLSDADIARAVRLRRRGWFLKQLAREFDVSIAALSRLFAGQTFGGRGRVEFDGRVDGGD